MPTGASFASFEKELNRLVDSFGRRIAELKSSSYVEAQLRDDFLNPFFRALGWDMENRAGLIQSHREVEIESRTDSGRADYLFRPERKARFVCEAKKPAEELHGGFAMQSKRYAWTIGVRLALLSDFEELKVYVVNGNPDKGEPDDGLIRHYNHQEYAAKAREIWDLLARDNVAGGSVERLIASLPAKLRPVRTKDFDEEFLVFLDGHRRALASDLIRHNDREDLLEGTKLNEAVQCILDRLLFIRISEARGIDMGTRLQSLLETWKRRHGKEKPGGAREEPPAGWGGMGLGAPRDSLWNSIVRHIRALDRRPPSHVPFFNGNLFKEHFSEELVVGDVWLAEFLDRISDENSSYKFGYVAVEILGTIYERFLGKVVRPHGRGAVIEEKPEVRKAGGVYYTPRYIVEYIVEQTVGKLLDGKKPEETLKLRFLDPACGSGSFLLRVFERVCEHWQQWLTDHPDQRKKDWCWLDAKTNTLHLTARTKRRILRETVHGVDLDPQAVEVTQLSLYLKMLEGETTETLEREQDLFGGEEAILPPLQNNIKCGNSLIASDFSMMPEDLVRVHAFDWNVGFNEIMKAGGFDAVVGNPPYVLISPEMFDEQTIEYLRHYEVAQYKADLFHLFIQKGISLAREKGCFGMIVPNTWLTLQFTDRLRRYIAEKSAISEVVMFDHLVFEDANVFTALLFVEKQKPAPNHRVAIRKVTVADSAKGIADVPANEVSQSSWKASEGCIFETRLTGAAGKLVHRLIKGFPTLESVARASLGCQAYNSSKHTRCWALRNQP
ncbi:MAG: N-6 DNA methylase [Verrucomicrobia bacterium]|nr:N-6 DNA methylase [Verrucomicrobiota bacterium]